MSKTNYENLENLKNALEDSLKPKLLEETYVSEYGDLSKLNSEKLILNAVGEEMLREIVSDYLDLLGTSGAVHEKNGDYALGIFSFGWCRLMDSASRKLCNTEDNRKALSCGKWLCHESCWSSCSKISIETKQPVDIECNGGIRLYAVPIIVDNEAVGAINFGYSSPPNDIEKLQILSDKFNIDIEKLKKASSEYTKKPDVIFKIAKNRLRIAANLISPIIKSYLLRRELNESSTVLIKTQNKLIATNEKFRLSNKNLQGLNEKLQTTNQKLRAQKDFTKNIINTAQAIVLVLDNKGKILDFNPYLEEISGYSIQESKGKDWFDMFLPERDRKKIRRLFLRSINNIKNNGNINPIIAKNGREIEIEWYDSTLNDKNDDLIGLLAIGYDITGRKKTEIEIQKKAKLVQIQHAELNYLYEKAPYGMTLVSPDLRYMRINQTLADMNGKTISEHLGHLTSEVVPKLAKVANQILKRVIDSGKPVLNQEMSGTTLVTPDKIRHWLTNYYPVNQEDGSLLGVGVIVNDITERKEIEEKIMLAAEEWKNTFDSIDDSVFILDMEHRFVKVNKAAYNMLKMTEEELIGKRCYEVLHKTTKSWAHSPLIETLKTKLPQFEEVDDPTIGIPLMVSTSPIFNKKGDITGVVHIARDISKQRKIQAELIQDQRIKAMGEVAAGIAHDFNNVLQGIILRSDVALASENISNELQDNLKRIKESAENSSGRIRQLLQFEQKDKIQKIILALNLNDIIKNSMNLISPKLSERNKNNRLKIDWVHEEALMVYSIQGILESAFFNILSNSLDAIHGDGEIIIRTEQKDGNVYITFSDTGIGMDRESASKIFNPFFTTKQMGNGTGVGLSGTYATIKNLDGDIYVKKTAPGKGTTIEIVLPLVSEKESKESKESKELKEFSTAKILWVDDNSDIREIGKALLEIIGHKTDFADSGKNALRALESTKYDIVITDIGMSEMNGWELAEQIKKKYHNTKIIVLSGWEHDIKDEVLKERGISSIIQKPINKEQLKDEIDKLIS